jgi:hypothetical protein
MQRNNIQLQKAKRFCHVTPWINLEEISQHRQMNASSLYLCLESKNAKLMAVEGRMVTARG